MPKPLLFGELEVPGPCPQCSAEVVPEVESRLIEYDETTTKEFIVLQCPRCGFVPPHVERERWRGEHVLDAIQYALWHAWFS